MISEIEVFAWDFFYIHHMGAIVSRNTNFLPPRVWGMTRFDLVDALLLLWSIPKLLSSCYGISGQKIKCFYHFVRKPEREKVCIYLCLLG